MVKETDDDSYDDDSYALCAVPGSKESDDAGDTIDSKTYLYYTSESRDTLMSFIIHRIHYLFFYWPNVQ